MIELRNAINADGKLAEAHYQLGLAYASLGELSAAKSEFATTILLQPNHIEAQLANGNMLLLDRKFDEARTTADLVLHRDPKHVRAQILLANTYSGIVLLNDSLGGLQRAFDVEPRLLPSYYDLASAGFHTQPELAEVTYKKAISFDEHSVAAKLALGSFYLQSQRTVEAEQQFRAALAIEPVSREAKQAMGFFYAQTKRLDLAEEVYTSLADSAPASQQLAQHVVLADFYAGIGKTEKAIDVLQKLVVEHPNQNIARKRLANLFLAQQNLGRAAQITDEVLKVDKTDLEGLFMKGRILVAQKKTAAGIAELRDLVRMHPSEPIGRFFLGLAYAQAGDLRRAETELLAVTEQDPAFGQAYSKLAEVKLKRGDVKAAIRYGQNALALNANFVEAHLALTRAYISAKDFKNAADQLDSLFKMSPGNAAVLHHRGLLYLAQGNQSRAEAEFEAAFKADPKQVDSLAALSAIYVGQNRPDKALQRINQAIAQQPENPTLIELLAEFFVSQKDETKAEEAYKRAVSLNPQNTDAKIMLGGFYLRTGYAEKATAVYEDILKNDPSNLDLKRQLANVYYDQRSFDRASQLAEELIKTNGKDTDAHVLKGRVLLAKGKNAEAVAELQSASNSDPESATARFFLGVAYDTDRKPDQAETAWNDAIRLDGQFAQAYLSLAQLKLKSQVPYLAVRYAEDALKADPNLSDAVFVLSDAKMMENDPANAATALETLVKRMPENATAFERLGAVYVAQGRLTKAETQFNEALRLNPKSDEALARLVGLYIQEGKPDKALQLVNQLLVESPGRLVPYELQGQIYLAQKNYLKAEESYRKVLSIDQNSVTAYALLGQLFLAQNSIAKAIVEFENVLRLDSKAFSAELELGSLYEAQNSLSKAQFYYREALKLDPKSPVAAIDLAWLMANFGENLDEALHLAQEAHETLHDSAKVLDTMGWIYYKKGAYASAVDLFRECSNKAPDRALCHYHLGMSYFKLGDRERARISLTQALKLDSKFPEADVARNTLADLSH